MDLKEIRKIIQMMGDHELTKFEMEENGFRISIKRGEEPRGRDPVMVQASAPVPAVSAPAPAPSVPSVPDDAPAGESTGGLVEIKSPIVGTFYRSSSPESDAFVSIGSEVSDDSVVCIVEAMKVMNEIHAECRGVIRKILIENASPVQFGQALFLVEPR
jgi:acetyl-CoA carboxylase biotin carboxyl carrier protein